MNHHTQILRIARAGNPARALRVFEERGLDEAGDDPRLLTLKGRLLKDRARALDGAERADFFARSIAAYIAAFEIKPDSYPLINAATLALLSGAADQSCALAQRALDLIESNPDEGETPYWREATRSEALLLLGQRGEAEAALASGIALLPMAYEDRAATIGQFERIIAEQGGDAGWLDAYRPPLALYFSGLIALDPACRQLKADIDRAVADLSPGYAFGALAAGADILIAEAVTAAGAELHVTLPFEISEFRDRSVEPFGGDWAQRFDRLLETAQTVTILTPDENRDFGTALSMASLASMGQAARQAQLMRSASHALTITSPDDAERLPIREWCGAGRALTRLETARLGQPTQGAEADIAAVLQDGSAHTAPIRECIKKARAALAQDPQKRLALVAGKDEGVSDDILAKLAQTIEPGQLAADQDTALVVQAMEPGAMTEELGEIATLSGRVPVWLIRL